MDKSESAKFLPFYQSLSLKLHSADMDKYEILPYDYHYPNIQKHLKDRICSVYHIYFASKKSVNNHRKELHPKIKQSRDTKLKPKKIITHRNKEALCIVEDDINEEKDVEWIPLEGIEAESLNENNELSLSDNNNEMGLPDVESMVDWLNSEWKSNN